MFGPTKENHAKLVALVSSILIASDKDKVFVDLYQIRKHFDVSKSHLPILLEEMRDILTYTGTVQVFGYWLLAEYEDELYVFVRMSKPGEKVGMPHMLMAGNAAVFTLTADWPEMYKQGRTKLPLPNVYTLPAAE